MIVLSRLKTSIWCVWWRPVWKTSQKSVSIWRLSNFLSSNKLVKPSVFLSKFQVVSVILIPAWWLRRCRRLVQGRLCKGWAKIVKVLFKKALGDQIKTSMILLKQAWEEWAKTLMITKVGFLQSNLAKASGCSPQRGSTIMKSNNHRYLKICKNHTIIRCSSNQKVEEETNILKILAPQRTL